MKIETLQIKDLTPDPENARQHDEKNLKAIQGSLNQFGQRKPIVITEAGVIVAGNGTVDGSTVERLAKRVLSNDSIEQYVLGPLKTDSL